jgi:hypothetical protein
MLSRRWSTCRSAALVSSLNRHLRRRCEHRCAAGKLGAAGRHLHLAQRARPCAQDSRFACEDLGEQSVNNIEQPIRAFRVRLSGGRPADESEPSPPPGLALVDQVRPPAARRGWSDAGQRAPCARLGSSGPRFWFRRFVPVCCGWSLLQRLPTGLAQAAPQRVHKVDHVRLRNLISRDGHRHALALTLDNLAQCLLGLGLA